MFFFGGHPQGPLWDDFTNPLLRAAPAPGVEDPLNIVACENAVKATTALKAFVLEKLEPADLEYVSAGGGRRGSTRAA